MQFLVVTFPPTCCLHVAPGHISFFHATHTMQVITLSSSMPPTQFPRHFRQRHPHPVYFSYQVGFLLFLFAVSDFHSCNDKSKGVFTSIFNSRTKDKEHILPYCLLIAGKIEGFMPLPSVSAQIEMQGFKLGMPIPLFTTIIITLSTPPYGCLNLTFFFFFFFFLEKVIFF